MKKIIFLFFLSFFANATEPVTTGGYQIGDAVADFQLKNVDGKLLSLQNFASAKGFILVFTSNHCPFSKSYEDRIVALHQTYTQQGYVLIAINPTDPTAYDEDTFVGMKRKAIEKGYAFPFLSDTSGSVAKAFGATRTPQAFVIKKENRGYVLKYAGAIDDNPQDANGVTKPYVATAVEHLLENKPVVVTQTKPIGCSIKWKM